jgi:cytochrome c oxidase subunit 2
LPLAALGACAGDVSALDPAGPVAHMVASLWWIMLAGAAILFLLVMGLFALAMLKPGVAGRLSVRNWILWGGLVMPVPVLAVLTYASLFQGERILRLDGAAAEAPLRIEARARRWQWEFRYLDAPGAAPTIDVLHIPAGRPVDLLLVSEDVIHSFWVPRLGGKLDAVPGHVNRLRLLADRPGAFGGVCAEFCGEGHAGMRFRVEAYEEAAYRARFEPGDAANAR